MRGSSKSLPKYSKHKASGQAVVHLSGTDFYLGPHGTKASKIEYDRLVGEWLANGRRLSVVSNEVQITIVELCAQYWRFCKTYYVKNGEATNEQAGVKAAIRFLKINYAKSFARDFGPLALEVVRQQMIDAGNSRRYINQNIGRIKRMFRWAVSKELIPVEIHQALATVPGLKQGKSNARETDRILPVEIEVVDATLEHATKIVQDMVRLQLLTGCRPGEICSIKPVEIDRSEVVWRYQPGSHKMEHKGRQRVILIGPQAQAILLPYLLRDASQQCFLRAKGAPMTRQSYGKRIKTACNKAFPAPPDIKRDAAKLKAWQKQHRWAPNRLRHTRATEIRKLYGLEAAQVVAGHSQADVTQIYAERDIEKAAKIMGEVG
ncbi:site-specific integrase [Mariniblastus sp.]|nr:site-specific integrase [Mariniblastus sp.]